MSILLGSIATLMLFYAYLIYISSQKFKKAGLHITLLTNCNLPLYILKQHIALLKIGNFKANLKVVTKYLFNYGVAVIILAEMVKGLYTEHNKVLNTKHLLSEKDAIVYKNYLTKNIF